MEPTLVQMIIQQWGPFGLVSIGGWLALKWLAARDDKRSEKMDAMMVEMTKVVANNTTAVSEISRSHDELREVVLNGGARKLNGVRARA